MGSLTALLLATPIFGFSLQAPALSGSLELSAKTATEIHAADALSAKNIVELPAADKAAASGASAAQADYVQQLKRRDNIASVHRIFGITTWAAMTATVALGAMAYYNRYGFGSNIGNNPCVKGTAIGGDGGCKSVSIIHETAAGVTSALYATTFTLSLMMPDPDKLAEGKGQFASTLRLHKALRWVHFSGMIAQILLGIVIAQGPFGLDRANHYGTLQALATVHMGVGLVTWGALTWAGSLMTF